MIHKPFDQVEKSDIDTLVSDAVAERRTLEYKLELPGRNDESKKEFLADVSSFANASGGDILYGVAEDKGVPTGAPGLAIADANAEILRLESIIRNGVAPRIPGLHTRPIIGFTQGPVLLIHVPRSFSSPHMVTLGGSSRFFTRTSAGKHPMDVGEIRSAFALSASLPEQLRRLRADRLAAILAGETPIALHPGPKLVLHGIPFSAFALDFQLDPAEIQKRRQAFFPPGRSGNDYRFNLDGFVKYGGMKDRDPPALHYCQVYRTGVIESVTTEIMGNMLLPRKQFEDDIIEAVESYLAAWRQLEVPLPAAVLVTMLGFRGYRMPSQDPIREFYPTPIDRDELLLPEGVIDEYTVVVGRKLKRIFDAIWNAAGYPRSPNYDESGERK